MVGKPKPSNPEPITFPGLREETEEEIGQIAAMASEKDVDGLSQNYPGASPKSRSKIIKSLFGINTFASIAAILSLLSNNHDCDMPGRIDDPFDVLMLSYGIGDYIIEKLLPKGHDIKSLMLDIWENEGTDEKTRELIENILRFCKIPQHPIFKCMIP